VAKGCGTLIGHCRTRSAPPIDQVGFEHSARELIVIWSGHERTCSLRNARLADVILEDTGSAELRSSLAQGGSTSWSPPAGLRAGKIHGYFGNLDWGVSNCLASPSALSLLGVSHESWSYYA